MRGASAEGLRNLVTTELSGQSHRPSRADSRPAGQPPPQRAAPDPAVAAEAQKAALSELLADASNRDAARVCLSTLLKLVGNVLANPSEPKYRSVKADNKAIKEKIIGCAGGKAMLLAAGFEHHAERPLISQAEMYMLPSDANLPALQEVKTGIETVLSHLGGPL